MPKPTEPTIPQLIARNRFLVAGTLMMVLGGMLFTASEALSFGANLLRPEVVYTAAVSLVLGGVSGLLFHYLRATSVSRVTFEESRLTRREMHEMASVMARLQDTIASLDQQTRAAERSSSVWTDEEREKVVNTLSQTVQGTLSDAFLESIESKYGSAISSASQQTEIRTICEESKRRLQIEIDALTRRSNINLIIGVITTLLAVGLLAFVVLSDKVSSTDIASVLLHFLPRLSIVVFIETFSFFFLRLYKSGLADIKYYQNELTGIESRHLALEAIISNQLPEQAHPILTQLVQTDRNNGSTGTAKDQKKAASIKDIESLLSKVSDIAGKATS
ncbi:hypothetical protein [Rosistilla oblonga]|uniref:hypothetical protein n=1 Tax=Rosistilla oblonga TaxID=2527990 RepID=UPI003A9763C7